jgi:hypothetical protein
MHYGNFVMHLCCTELLIPELESPPTTDQSAAISQFVLWTSILLEMVKQAQVNQQRQKNCNLI